mgnify:FL=1
MVRGGRAGSRPFRRELERWKAVGGGLDQHGDVLNEPWQLTRARFIDSMCQRYGCLPSRLLEEDVGLILQMHSILTLAGDHETAAKTEDSMEESLSNMSRGM